eukprot:scaffold95232_cov37-Tisochrysis_lutea.AAC.1
MGMEHASHPAGAYALPADSWARVWLGLHRARAGYLPCRPYPLTHGVVCLGGLCRRVRCHHPLALVASLTAVDRSRCSAVHI